MEESTLEYIYLHGLGQTASSWQPVLQARSLPGTSRCLDLVELLRGQEASYQNLYAAFSRQCQQTAEKVTLCGLSLGAVLALNYAIDHPEGVEALVLIAPQYKMPKKLLWLQNLMFRFMPESQFQETGFKKKDFVSLCQTAAVLDFTDSLGAVQCPTLVVCGAKDSANRRAAGELAVLLPHARLMEVPGAGHEVNTQAPEALAEILQRFYAHL